MSQYGSEKWLVEEISKVVQNAILQEREACAAMVEEWGKDWDDPYIQSPFEILAVDIRRRSSC
jgi:hypothetical protein